MPSVNVYYVGETVLLTATFTSPDTGAAVDPSAVVCRVSDPSGSVTTPSVTKSATGIYTAQITLNSAGIWMYEFEGTGANPQVNYGELKVLAAPF